MNEHAIYDLVGAKHQRYVNRFVWVPLKLTRALSDHLSVDCEIAGVQRLSISSNACGPKITKIVPRCQKWSKRLKCLSASTADLFFMPTLHLPVLLYIS